MAKEDPDITLEAKERRIGGLGIFLVKEKMDDMVYFYENGQNVLTYIKNFYGFKKERVYGKRI